ncbi:MAG: hypothetical protein OXG04_07250 [Acidobacteria bacterium]|nr:hypothetical protein [Acidobacteriota bacterium]
MTARLLPFCAVLVLSSACSRSPGADVVDGARGVMEQVRDTAVLDISREELAEDIVESYRQVADLSADEIRRLSAIEYRTVFVPDRELESVDAVLAEIGLDRWECFHVGDDAGGKTFYFQRRASNLVPNLMRAIRVGGIVF